MLSGGWLGNGTSREDAVAVSPSMSSVESHVASPSSVEVERVDLVSRLRKSATWLHQCLELENLCDS